MYNTNATNINEKLKNETAPGSNESNLKSTDHFIFTVKWGKKEHHHNHMVQPEALRDYECQWAR